MENIEVIENREPGDIDVVTFFNRPSHVRDDVKWDTFWPTAEPLFDSDITKPTFKVDAYPLDMNEPSEQVVYGTRYWFGLFSHRRVSKQWKGILQIPLSLTALDTEAWNLLKEPVQS